MAHAQSPTSKEQWLDSIVERLTCPLCFEIYSDPVALRCGHTLCKVCIKRWSSASAQGQWICPLCKREDAIVHVENLDVNYTLKNLCQEYKDYCEEKHHNFSYQNEGKALKKESNQKCKRHPKEIAFYICMTCKEKFCGTCSAVERKHSDVSHQVYTVDKAVKPVTKVYDQLKQRVTPLFAKMNKKNDTLTQVQSNLSATEAEVKQHCTELKNKLCRLVDCQMSVLLQPINNREVSNGIRLKQLQQLYDDALNLQTDLESHVTEQNVIDRVDAILPLMGSVESLEQSVEQCCQSLIPAIPPFNYSEDLYESAAFLVKESCGTVKESDGDNVKAQCSEPRKPPIPPKELHHPNDASPSVKSHQDDTIVLPCFSGLAIVTNVVSQDANANHRPRGTHLHAKAVAARQMCSFSMECRGWRLEHVAWVANYVLVADMESSCIWCINHNSGDVNILYQYDWRYKPFAICASRNGDAVKLAVNVIYKGKWKNVNLHEIDVGHLGESDLQMDDDFFKFLGGGYRPVSLTRDMICCINKDLDIQLYLLHERELVTVENTQYWDQAHISSNNEDTVLYAIANDENDIILKYEVTDSDLYHVVDYATSTCKSISCLQTDKSGFLWVLDRVGKKLVKFSSTGDLVCTLHLDVSWLSQIHSIHFSNRSIFMLVKVEQNSDLSIICISWPPSDQVNSYTLSNLIYK